MLSRDIKRLAGLTAEIGAGEKLTRSAGFGPPGKRMIAHLTCHKRGTWGPGRGEQCTSMTIRRTGTGVEKLRMAKQTSVGNVYGLATQLSRDISRLWGCAPGSEKGFEGARRRRRKR